MYHQHQHELRDGTGEREEVAGAGSAMRPRAWMMDVGVARSSGRSIRDLLFESVQGCAL
jgi:hypothetical protein